MYVCMSVCMYVCMYVCMTPVPVDKYVSSREEHMLEDKASRAPDQGVEEVSAAVSQQWLG